MYISTTQQIVYEGPSTGIFTQLLLGFPETPPLSVFFSDCEVIPPVFLNCSESLESSDHLARFGP